jgi:TRAP-type transport system periplasmic protein
MLDWGGLFNWNMADVVKNNTDCPGIAYTTSFYTVMNKDKWDSLPPDIQAIIDKLDEEWVVERIQKKWTDWQAMGKAKLAEKGNNLIVLSPEENARWAGYMGPVLEEWVKATKAKGVPADDALKFCQDYLKANDK